MGDSLKVCVTGGSSGIGKALCHQLLAQGADVFFVSSNADRAAAAAQEMQAAQGRRPTYVVADLATHAGVRRTAEALAGWTPTLQALVNSASRISPERHVTEDGLEQTFALNYLAYFHLTGLLSSSLSAAGGRIINVAAAPIPWVRLRFDDLQGQDAYSSVRAYLQSKLGDVMFTYELAKRRADLITVAVHPGVVRTGLGGEFRSRFAKTLLGLMRPLAMTPDAAAKRLTAIVLDREAPTGTFFAAGRPRRSSQASYDEQAQQRLWDASVALIGYDPFAR